MVLIIGDVYCLMQWYRDTSEVKLGLIVVYIQCGLKYIVHFVHLVVICRIGYAGEFSKCS